MCTNISLCRVENEMPIFFVRTRMALEDRALPPESLEMFNLFEIKLEL